MNNMPWDINLQLEVKKEKNIPTLKQFKLWCNQTLTGRVKTAEVTLRIVPEYEMISLNNTWRGKNKPTNVLSFPLHLDEELLIGDIVICKNVVEKEALEQNKSVESHWAHMVIHGLLHILGFDHEKNDEAEIMEAEEILILKNLGFPNPYQEGGP